MKGLLEPITADDLIARAREDLIKKKNEIQNELEDRVIIVLMAA